MPGGGTERLGEHGAATVDRHDTPAAWRCRSRSARRCRPRSPSSAASGSPLASMSSWIACISCVSTPWRRWVTATDTHVTPPVGHGRPPGRVICSAHEPATPTASPASKATRKRSRSMCWRSRSASSALERVAEGAHVAPPATPASRRRSAPGSRSRPSSVGSSGRDPSSGRDSSRISASSPPSSRGLCPLGVARRYAPPPTMQATATHWFQRSAAELVGRVDAQALDPEAADAVAERRTSPAAGRRRAGSACRSRAAARRGRGSTATRRGTSGGTCVRLAYPATRCSSSISSAHGRSVGLAEQLLVEPVAPPADGLGERQRRGGGVEPWPSGIPRRCPT